MNRGHYGRENILFNNKYEQVRLLGEGSFGKAFLVETLEDKTLAVIKSIDLGSMSDDEKSEAIQEGKILEKLDHPNIIKFREVYIEEKSGKQILNIVMDYADGGDLQQRIRGQKGKYFSETVILDWFTQICLSIKHIHDRKILHRDIKSQNIFLTKNGLVKLGDFGIAKCLNKTIDKAKTIVGTPYYLSPEIVQNKPYSFKSDIWSLGVLLYEMCALKMPFDAQNLPLLSLKIIRCSYNPLPPNFSKELRSLVNIMLSVDTNKRFSINEVLRQPIIKSRIKNFLNEMEFNKEFSHTILHNFKILKSNKQDNFDLISSREMKERENLQNQFQYQVHSQYPNNEKKIIEREYQKPIIKKDSVEKVINVKANNKKNSYEKDFGVNNNFNKEREIENYNNLKRNLSSAQNVKDNNRGLVINPNFGVQNEKGKKINLDIESRTPTPKLEVGKLLPDSKSSNDRRASDKDKKSELSSNHVYENLKKNNLKKKDLNINLLKDSRGDSKEVNKKVNDTNNSQSTNADINTDRKRSGSRGSQNDENKEKPILLKEFMKNMKENMKNSPKVENDVIWMKGMNNFSDKEILNKKEIDNKYAININSNVNLVAPKNRDSEIINYHFKNKHSKDIKDYIETQKMLIELEKLQNEEYLEEFLPENQNDNNDILNEFNCLNQEFTDIEELSVNQYQNLALERHGFEKIHSSPTSTDNETNNIQSDEKIENSLKCELETDIGKELFQDVYNILKENLNTNVIFYDYDNLVNKIKSQCSNYPVTNIELCINRLPDIYCLIIRERDSIK